MIVELIAVGQPVAALSSLSGMVLGTKYPMNFVVPSSSSATSANDYVASTDLEAVVLRVIELGVSLRRGRLVKEVLLHLRAPLQAVHSLSFEFVLRNLLQVAGTQLHAAQAKLEGTKDDLVVSLDLDEDAQLVGAGQTEEREIVTPWLRFYWEILRVALDISRNNGRLELVYHDVVLQAFDFCRRYSRKSELRRLCEMIRYHLGLTLKYPNQTNAVSLTTSPESHQLALDLRFAQLALTSDLELWQEAFRTVEDIHGLMQLVRRSTRQVVSPTYFEKLARIFLMSGNYLFLAATLNRQPALDGRGVALLALAALAAPLSGASETAFEEQEQLARLAQITGLTGVPVRAQLLQDARTRLEKLPAGPVARFFRLMEGELTGCAEGVSVLAELAATEDFRLLLRPCYENLLRRLMQGLLKTRDSIALSELKALAAVEEARRGIAPGFNLELFLAVGMRDEVFTGIRMDHAQDLLVIDRSMALANPEPFAGASSDMTWSLLHTQMQRLLDQVSEANRVRVADGGSLGALLAVEHRANLDRRVLIERRKEVLEQLALERERVEARERAIKMQQDAEAERLRVAEETARRDRERLERERAEIRRLETEKRLVEQERLKEAAGARLNREKLNLQATQMDHLERALRAQECPLLEADYATQKAADRSAYDSRCALIVEMAQTRHARDLEIKKKLVESPTMAADYAHFLARAQTRRQEEYEAAVTHATEQLLVEKKKRRDRIAGEMEARRRIEAERERPVPSAQERSFDMSAVSAGAGVGVGVEKYVPPARTASWRREESPAMSAAVESPATVSAAPVSPANVSSSEPQKAAYVPKHKRVVS